MKGIIKTALVLGGMYGVARLGFEFGSAIGFGYGLKDNEEVNTIRTVVRPEKFEIKEFSDLKRLWEYIALTARDWPDKDEEK
jgi:hypothetical protein